MFLAKQLIGYHGNSKWPIPKFLILKDDQYNCVKSQKVWWKPIKPFLRYLAKAIRLAILPLPLPPIQIGLNFDILFFQLNENCQIV